MLTCRVLIRSGTDEAQEEAVTSGQIGIGRCLTCPSMLSDTVTINAEVLEALDRVFASGRLRWPAGHNHSVKGMAAGVRRAEQERYS